MASGLDAQASTSTQNLDGGLPGEAQSGDTEKGASPPPQEERDSTNRRKGRVVSRLRVHSTNEVSTNHADILLLTCCFISGLVDSTIYNAYGTFVSMQTGNTIFVGLGGATSFKRPPNPKPYGWAKSLVSISCFCFGCFFFSQFMRHFHPLRRLTLVFSFLIQAILILVSAAIVQTGAVDGNLDTIVSDINWKTIPIIALLSFQSSGQIIGSRTLNLSEIPSVVVTSMMCDLSSDPNLVGKWRTNVKRNRRALAFLMILVGAVAGGFISESSGKMEVVLWIAGALKIIITGAWMFWPKAKPKVDGHA